MPSGGIVGPAGENEKTLFDEWARSVETEILGEIVRHGKMQIEFMATAMRTSEESIIYFLSRLVRSKQIRVTEVTAISVSSTKQKGD